MEDPRPAIDSFTSSPLLRQWYWLKDELVAEARRRGLSTAGGKFDLLDRICANLDGKPMPARKAKATSRFDWHAGPIGRDTVITDSYKNTQCVRRFFQAELGDDFHFTIALMDWMRSNIGRTMADAVAAAQHLRAQARVPGFKTEIKPHNQWNAYQRAYLADNPAARLADARQAWAKKRRRPSPDGKHVYARSDLEL